jgi:hypothetical protein
MAEDALVRSPKPQTAEPAKPARPGLFDLGSPLYTGFTGVAGAALVALPGVWTWMPGLGLLGAASLAVAAWSLKIGLDSHQG